MNTPLTIECQVHFSAQAKGRKELHPGRAAAPVAPGRVPRVAQVAGVGAPLRAVAARGRREGLCGPGAVGPRHPGAASAKLWLLLCLAPDLQEEILFWPPTVRGKDRVQMHTCCPSRLYSIGKNNGSAGRSYGGDHWPERVAETSNRLQQEISAVGRWGAKPQRNSFIDQLNHRTLRVLARTETKLLAWPISRDRAARPL